MPAGKCSTAFSSSAQAAFSFLERRRATPPSHPTLLKHCCEGRIGRHSQIRAQAGLLSRGSDATHRNKESYSAYRIAQQHLQRHTSLWLESAQVLSVHSNKEHNLMTYKKLLS